MTTPATIPSPAALPGAGLSRAELLRRQEAAQDAADALLAGAPAVPPELLAPPGDLERLTADQGVRPVVPIGDLGPPAGTFTDAESEAFQAAIRDRHAEPSATPTPDASATGDDPEPGPTHAPVGLNRYQDIRDRALGHAIRFYEQDDQADVDDQEVIATADRFADWIRRGYHL